MADIKFSEFTSNTTPALTDEVVGLQSGINKRTTLQRVKDLFLTGLTTNYLPKKTSTGFADSLIYDNGTRVGIGTSNPLSILYISDNSVSGSIINIINTSTSSAGISGVKMTSRTGETLKVYAGANADGSYIGTETNSNLQFITNNTVRSTLWANGQFSHNTTLAGYDFTIGGILRILNNNNNNRFYINTDGGSTVGLAAGTHIYADGNISIFENSGAVGINIQTMYWNGSQYYSAWSIANVASGFGSLKLMKDGGNVIINSSSDNGAIFQVNGDITTSAPSGGSVGKWKLGQKASATVSLVTTDYIQVEIDGVAYKLALVN